MIVTFPSNQIAPNQLPDGAIKFDDGMIKVDLTADQLIAWMNKFPEVKEVVFMVMVKAIQNGDVKIG